MFLDISLTCSSSNDDMNDHFNIKTSNYYVYISLIFFFGFEYVQCMYVIISQALVSTPNNWAVMGFSKLYLYLLLINASCLVLVSATHKTSTALDSKNRNVVNVGLILDFNSSIGFVANSCISMAVSDFYSKNPHYSTRLALHPKNSNNVLTAASAGDPRVIFLIKSRWFCL